MTAYLRSMKTLITCALILVLALVLALRSIGFSLQHTAGKSAPIESPDCVEDCASESSSAPTLAVVTDNRVRGTIIRNRVAKAMSRGFYRGISGMRRR